MAFWLFGRSGDYLSPVWDRHFENASPCRELQRSKLATRGAFRPPPIEASFLTISRGVTHNAFRDGLVAQHQGWQCPGGQDSTSPAHQFLMALGSPPRDCVFEHLRNGCAYPGTRQLA